MDSFAVLPPNWQAGGMPSGRREKSPIHTVARIARLTNINVFRVALPGTTAIMRLSLLVPLLACLPSRTLALLVAPALHRPALLQRPRVAAASVRCAEGDDEESIVERLGLPNLISDESNPYLTSKADRMRAKFGEQSVAGQSARSGGREGVEDRLFDDIARFKVRLESRPHP